MRFWDSSAIVPLLVAEPSTGGVGDGTEGGCVSALARLEREDLIAAPAMGEALARLNGLALAWHEIQPAARTRQVAVRLLRAHNPRAADALQLAAAIVAGGGL